MHAVKPGHLMRFDREWVWERSLDHLGGPPVSVYLYTYQRADPA
jgi:hypothetical protein